MRKTLLQTDMPFTVKGVQADGGSEFMAEFETECEKRDIALFVLPPRSPKLNGGAERCNGAWRYEFYAVYDLPTRLDDLNAGAVGLDQHATPGHGTVDTSRYRQGQNRLDRYR